MNDEIVLKIQAIAKKFVNQFDELLEECGKEEDQFELLAAVLVFSSYIKRDMIAASEDKDAELCALEDLEVAADIIATGLFKQSNLDLN